MVAVVIIERLTGAGPARTDITSINTRANAEDAHSTGDTANPIEIPGAGTNYSFWVNTQLNATTAPDNLIDNIEWFTDAVNSYGTGIGSVVAQAALASYTQAPGTIGVTGTELNDTNYTGGTLTPATPLDSTLSIIAFRFFSSYFLYFHLEPFGPTKLGYLPFSNLSLVNLFSDLSKRLISSPFTISKHSIVTILNTVRPNI